jgi:hypothetical protein
VCSQIRHIKRVLSPNISHIIHDAWKAQQNWLKGDLLQVGKFPTQAATPLLVISREYKKNPTFPWVTAMAQVGALHCTGSRKLSCRRSKVNVQQAPLVATVRAVEFTKGAGWLGVDQTGTPAQTKAWTQYMRHGIVW